MALYFNTSPDRIVIQIEEEIEERGKNMNKVIYYINFGQALKELKQGKRVARQGWNGKGIFIELQVPDKNSKMTSPYIYIDTTSLQTNNTSAPKSRVPWLASQTDMLADDWYVLEENSDIDNAKQLLAAINEVLTLPDTYYLGVKVSDPNKVILYKSLENTTKGYGMELFEFNLDSYNSLVEFGLDIRTYLI